MARALKAWVVVAALVAGHTGCTQANVPGRTPAAPAVYRLSRADDRFLEDLSRRSFAFFWEQADVRTGIIRDRSRTDGGPASEDAAHIGSIASVGFGLSGLCIAAARGWQPRAGAIDRAETTLRWFAENMPQEHGWFYHFVNLETGARAWQSELSSIDTALLLAGVLTVRRCFADDAEVVRYADAIYRRVDFQWMLAGSPTTLSHGWKPESGFLAGRWDRYCELMILYTLAIGSPSHPIPAASWFAWSRPVMTFGPYTYVSWSDPLFVHQYAHAWIDFRRVREGGPSAVDWFQNSVTATRAHRAFVLSLAPEFPGYSDNIWGITASDSRKGYVAWGGPPRHPAIDGTVVPAAAAGSLMFAPDITVPALREMHRRFGDRIYGRYGFADAFDPADGWVNRDVIGIDLGITLLSAENLRTGRVWSWFLQNPEIAAAFSRIESVGRPPGSGLKAQGSGQGLRVCVERFCLSPEPGVIRDPRHICPPIGDAPPISESASIGTAKEHHMNLRLGTSAALAIALVSGIGLYARTAGDAKPGVDWPQFRGIRATGVGEGFALPASWNVAKGQGIAWKTAVPGLGLSSPIVWGDLTCVSTSISGQKDAGLKVGLYGDVRPVLDDTEHEWRIYCLDKKTGAVRWQQTVVKEVPKIKRHTKASHANSTLATDGERLVAFFGSEGLYAYDLKGKLLWKKDLGVLDGGWYTDPSAQWETGSSPILHDNVVVIQADVQRGSFLGAFDARDGKELWRVARTDVPTWGTPTVHQVNGQTQLIVNGWRHMGAYDFKTGKEIWKLTGGGDIPVPTPVVQDGLIFITNAHGPKAPIYAIRETATGDITLADGSTSNAGVAWSAPREGGYMCTPLVYRGLVYIVKYNGVLSAYDAKTGEVKFQQRLAGGLSAFTSSPVAADGKVYLASEEGHVYVLKAGPAFEVLAENDMTESVLSTPAISEGSLLYRTQNHVIAVRAAQ